MKICEGISAGYYITFISYSVSSKHMVVKKLILVLVMAAVIAACAAPEEKPTATPTPTEVTPEKAEVQTIYIGVLIDLSGPLTTYGEDIKNMLTIARDDINSYFESNNKPYKVDFYFEDTKVDPNLALQKIMSLHGKGVKLVVGPMGSGEVKNIIEYVNSNKIIIVSPSSTAPPKYIGISTPDEKKYVFRFVATDAFQTKAIAKLASELGVKAVVITYIGNAWGKGLEEYGRAEFEKAGITVKSPSVEYPDPPPADFTPYIATLENYVDELMETYSADEIAVVTFSYEEVATMLAQVKDDSVLLKVKWIGCDGTAKSSKVIEDVPEKAGKIGLYSTVSEQRGEESFERVNKTYYEMTGSTPKAYGLNAYDAAWVLALAYAELYDELGKYDADKMAEKIPEVAKKYSEGQYGVLPVSGFIDLDEFNDRIVPEYKIYAVENGTWVEKGTWNYETNEITWR